MATPDWDMWLASQWGGSAEEPEAFPLLIQAASNVIVGSNPSYTIQDLLILFPKFGGPTLQLQGTLTANSPNVSSIDTNGLSPGNLVAGNGIPDGATILSIPDAENLVLSGAATASGTTPLTVWNSPVIPLAALTAFILLASASLVQARWLEQWNFAMALFIAHYASLYARSDGNPSSTIGNIAAQAITTGIQVAKSVGDVNVSYQPIQGIEEWGAWNLTVYGQQLATMAKVIGAGSMLLW
jgi:hypothetical protein